MVGFRFPARAEGMNVPGYHLHFVSADRKRGGHVLDCEVSAARVEVDDSVDVRLEVPAGVELPASRDEAQGEALRGSSAKAELN
jgi:acetolactate decarboxylase